MATVEEPYQESCDPQREEAEVVATAAAAAVVAAAAVAVVVVVDDGLASSGDRILVYFQEVSAPVSVAVAVVALSPCLLSRPLPWSPPREKSRV